MPYLPGILWKQGYFGATMVPQYDRARVHTV